MSSVLEIRNLHVSINDAPILKGVNLVIKEGETHALMGPNGSGKSTLAYAITGHPMYEVTAGEVILDGVNILELEADERSRMGLFLAFQYPVAVPGVTVANFLRQAINARLEAKSTDPDFKGISIPEFTRLMRSKMDLLGIDHKFAGRYLNDGFSGGEKKRNEILQLAVLEPRYAILDETDSGLDIDALRIVADGVNRLKGPGLGVLVITHYKRMLDYLAPQHVHLMMDGRVVESGGPELADDIEARGYRPYFEKHGLEVTED
ncbi:MAG: Fe-S cluster assembly ATPase SufC [Anaerolineae bacterium]|nr:Fe-S cluster assembly ATPase SufC [Anaerolineae bacterium]